MKVCPKCNTEKTFSEYHKDNTKRDGHTSYCIICAKESARSHYSQNNTRSRISKNNYTHYDETQKQILSRLKNLTTKARLRTKWDHNIDFEYLYELWVKQEGRCAYSGLPLSLEANQLETLSLDRINSKIGYQKGNVQLVCSMVNRMKQEFCESDFIRMCHLIAEKNDMTTHKEQPHIASDYLI